MESFLEKIDQQVAARIDQTVSARLAPRALAQQVQSAIAHAKRTLLTGVVIGIFITGIPAVMAAARNETNLLLALAVILAVVISVVALAGNLHRSRRSVAPDR